LDAGKCSECMKDAHGYFGPEGFEWFYCIPCWLKYWQTLKPQEKKEWQSTVPRRSLPVETKRLHQFKTVLLAAHSAKAIVWFKPGSVNSYERWQLHKMCEEEPELCGLQHRSFGPRAARMLRIAPEFKEFGFGRKEALCMLQGETQEELAEGLEASLTEVQQAVNKQDLSTIRGLKALEEQLLKALNRVTKNLADLEGTDQEDAGARASKETTAPAATAEPTAPGGPAVPKTSTPAHSGSPAAPPAKASAAGTNGGTPKASQPCAPAPPPKALAAGMPTASQPNAPVPPPKSPGASADEDKFPPLAAAAAKPKAGKKPRK